MLSNMESEIVKTKQLRKDYVVPITNELKF